MEHERHNWKTHDEGDTALDAALAKYASVEPRAGLEDRILSHLRSVEARGAGRAWWNWRLAIALAAVLSVTAALAWRWNRPIHPPVAEHPAAPKRLPGSNQVANGTRPTGGNREATTRRQRVSRPTQHEVVARNPKLDVFPSRLPLSAEEIALTQYVRNFPKDAQLVAQAQEEFDLETEKEMNQAGSSQTRLPGSIQQER